MLQQTDHIALSSCAPLELLNAILRTGRPGRAKAGDETFPRLIRKAGGFYGLSADWFQSQCCIPFANGSLAKLNFYGDNYSPIQV